MRSIAVTLRRIAFAVAATVVILDQATKAWAQGTLPGDPIVIIDGFFRFRFVTNSGAAFGLLRGAGSLLALAAIIAAVLIAIAVRSLDRRLEAVALGMVLGGAIGNLMDRVFRGDGFLDGRVIDWIDFSFWPTFNLADSAITIGAVLAVLGLLRNP
ncbi:MAG: signal peptidase II [Acidimicrobiia bacterium]